jgi:hypothetical protein
MSYGHSRFRTPSARAGLPLRVAFAVVIVAAAHVVASAANGPSMRAMWLSPTAMSSLASIRRAIATALAGGFDAIVAPVPVGTRTDSNAFDAGTEALREARERGLGAHLSVTVNVAAGVNELPAARDHVIYQHPEWLMVPRQLAPELLKIDQRSPAYLGRITRWTRVNADRVDGVYVSPLDPAAMSYLVNAVTTAVERYAADGVYLDAIDFPGPDFDYSRHAMDLFRTRMRAVMSIAERARLDEIEAIDPFAYAEEFPDEWRQYREAALTTLFERLKLAITTIKPAVSIAIGARADAEASLREHLQPWGAWLARGIVDRIGYRSRTSGTVLVSPDGAVAPPPEQSPNVQAAGAGGPR